MNLLRFCESEYFFLDKKDKSLGLNWAIFKTGDRNRMEVCSPFTLVNRMADADLPREAIEFIC